MGARLPLGMSTKTDAADAATEVSASSASEALRDAAPDLLDALVTLCVYHDVPGKIDPVLAGYLRDARAIIAKAIGQ